MPAGCVATVTALQLDGQMAALFACAQCEANKNLCAAHSGLPHDDETSPTCYMCGSV